jgi:tetratricopeptide (TPR) repeat protein
MSVQSLPGMAVARCWPLRVTPPKSTVRFDDCMALAHVVCAVQAAFNVLMTTEVPDAAAELDSHALFQTGRKRKGEELELSKIFHTRGINMRYLPQVAARCRNAAAREFLEQEVIVRAAKHKIRALLAEHAETEQHAAEILDRLMRELYQRGPESRRLWAQFSLPNGEPKWDFLERLSDAIGFQTQAVTLAPKIKSVRPPPFTPLEKQEQVLLKDLEFCRATGADRAPVQFKLYQTWCAGADPRDSFAKGEAVLQELVQRHRRGPPFVEVLPVAADWYEMRGKFEQALAFCEEHLGALRARPGPDPDEVNRALDRVGDMHASLGSFQRALSVHEEVLQSRRKTRSGHPDIGRSLWAIGTCHKALGDVPKALQGLVEAQQLLESLLGAEHRVVACAARDIGIVYEVRTLSHALRAAWMPGVTVSVRRRKWENTRKR